MNILTFTEYYLPGYKGGGPLRTLSNVVDRLGDEFGFEILTRDRDLGDSEPYSGVVPVIRRQVGKAGVFYLAPGSLSFRELRAMIRSVEHDALYLNSFFSPAFTIKPLILWRLGLVPRVPLILAPRGEFSPGALALKGLKKRVYLLLSRSLRLYAGITWQASSEYEAEDIRRWFGNRIAVVVAPDLPAPIYRSEEQPRRHKKSAGSLKVLFLSRVSRMKNLDAALEMLKGLEGDVRFDIYGPLEDEDYWARCCKIIDTLPENIQVRYRGMVSYEQVAGVMAEHDLFLFPTLGENFGHVILEALLAGCPVLISDQTPWRGLRERGGGWDLPLDRPERFREVLQRCVEMRAQVHQFWSRGARSFGLNRAQDHTAVQQYRELFRNAAVDSEL